MRYIKLKFANGVEVWFDENGEMVAGITAEDQAAMELEIVQEVCMGDPASISIYSPHVEKPKFEDAPVVVCIDCGDLLQTVGEQCNGICNRCQKNSYMTS